MKNILITTLPFARFDKSSINLLKKNNINYYWNPRNKKFPRKELLKIIHKFDGIICGVDKIDKIFLKKAKRLKIVSRVGVGLNNLDLQLLRKNLIKNLVIRINLKSSLLLISKPLKTTTKEN